MTPADALPGASWARLLPAHRADGDDQPVGDPVCVGTLPLADGLALAVVEDGHGRTYPVPLVTRDGGPARRAVPGDGAAEALVALLSASGAAPADGFRVTAWHHAAARGERAITVDQTNESVVVGDAAVVKWAFLADEGPHPAPTLLAGLDAAGFTGMPRPWGVIEWRGRLLASVVDYVPFAADGWTWAVDDIRSAVEHDEQGPVDAAARAVGTLVASLHTALRGTARLATASESAAWRRDALDDLDRALAVTSGAAHSLLSTHAGTVRDVLDALPAGDTPVLRVHGDLHVGQVLRSHTYLLTDFDGNPVVPAAERTREQPAALDVAGMAQSFTHAGLVVRRHHPHLDAAAVDRAAAAARAAFLDAYRAGLGPDLALLDERLLVPFALRQVCREFSYAATHLPRWSYVPEAALVMLLEGDRP